MPEIVDDHDVGARVEQCLDTVHTDEAGAAGDDDSLAGHRRRHQVRLMRARRKSAVLAGRSAMRRMR